MSVYYSPVRHARNVASGLMLMAALGFSSPLTPLALAQTSSPNGTVELSPGPPNVTQSVPPNVAITFDDSGSMQWDFLSDNPPWLTFSSSGYNQPINVTWDGYNHDTGTSGSGGPWYCAGVINPTATSGINTHVMNGVYYNPNVTYTPPSYADGTSFPNADATLQSVWNDGVSWNRPLSPDTSDGTTNFTNSSRRGRAQYWNCPYDYVNNGGQQGYYLTQTYAPNTNGSSPVSGGGPYYYQYTGPTVAVDQYGNPTSAGLTNLYKASNWQAVSVPQAQYQNWANWWAYYRTHNQAARSALARVFASSNLAGTTSSGGYGGTIRVAWQNLYNGNYNIYDQFVLQTQTIITSLIDANPATCKANEPVLGSQSLFNGTTTTPPSCYRSDFFNWIFQVQAISGTPTRGSLIRAGTFFTRGNGNTGATGDLHDPYWQPPASGTGIGSELSCRQNFHLLLTDGLWNSDSGLPSVSSLQSPGAALTLPDGTPFPATSNAVTAIYGPQHDTTGAPSLSDLAFNYWATNLRPDLYNPTNNQFVPPYLPDTTLGVTPTTLASANGTNNANVNAEIYFNPANDPANWPHMSEYLVGMGVSGQLNFSTNTDCTNTTTPSSSDACNLRKGTTNSSGSVGWPQPSSTAGGGNGAPANIDDTWHAALAGRGQFFSAGNPQQLVDQLSNILTSITARAAQPAISAVNASVLTAGALSFNTGYSTVDWSGLLQAVTLNTDGTIGGLLWDAAVTLNNASITSPTTRQILTASLSSSTASIASGISFESGSAFDASESSTSPGGLMYPVSTNTNDTLTTRVNYLRGDRTQENGVLRKRNSLLGAIINSQATYVSYPSSGYTDTFPAGSPEAIAAAASNGTDDKSYGAFITDHSNRDPMLYVGANDGMLHAFNAPVPTCTATDANGNCTNYNIGNFGSAASQNASYETFAYIPRGVYGNLGNLTSANSFSFAPTVDATPVVRDVFSTIDSKWHSLLVGGLRLGGRGVYALDITNPPVQATPSSTTETQSTSTVVKWEFDYDMTAPSSCIAVKGSGTDSTGCRSSDLGYTYGQPNIGRLANGKWVVIVPSGYFPDCSNSDRPPNCGAAAAQAPKDSNGNPYSALFVLDANTGAMIAELKTPASNGVTSYGLSSPVLGDYNGDQIDDVAFAGDLVGNLWRFDLSNSNPALWTVSLAYQPTTPGPGPGTQPITVMPRLFPDPATNRFIVVFGTGKYLGANDNSSTTMQSVYGIRDMGTGSSPLTRSTLLAQTLSESPGTGAYAGATLRNLTNKPLSATQGGWYFDLNLSSAPGERVVVTPAALFNTNTLVLTTLIPGSINPCNPSVEGAAMFINAANGGAGTGVSALGGGTVVGARVNNVRTSGSIPVTTVIGGGQTLLPGLTLTGKQSNPSQPLAGDAPIWRRRSWSELDNAQ